MVIEFFLAEYDFFWEVFCLQFLVNPKGLKKRYFPESLNDKLIINKVS